jgi:NAD(P)-dependent dehydrogenase (short-subunit alcohol dehydrogenase family)
MSHQVPVGETKIALVTGASRGLGLGIVKRLHALGYTVVATCRSPATATELAAFAATTDGATAVHVFEMDVSSTASVAACYAHVAFIYKQLDLVVNNAAMVNRTFPDESILTASLDESAAIHNVNVLGPLRVVQHFWPLIDATPGARLLFISSSLGSIANNVAGGCQGGEFAGQRVSYRTSKAALNQVVATLAGECKGNGRVFVTLCPGWVRTDMGNSGGRVANLEIDDSVQRLIATALSVKSDAPLALHGSDGVVIPW